MANSDERREAVKKLRMYGRDALKDGSLLKTLKDVTGADSWRDVLLALADLIDPTCHVVGTTLRDLPDGSTVYVHELSCGHTRETSLPEPPAFCGECGAKVVSDDGQ